MRQYKNTNAEGHGEPILNPNEPADGIISVMSRLPAANERRKR